MEKKVKSRRLQMNMVGSYIGKCKEIYNNFDESKHFTLLQTYESSMRKKIEKAEEEHNDILNLLDDETEMAEEEETFSEFRINAENELLILREFILTKKNPSNDQASSISSSTSSGRNMRLPKLTIKRFDGNPLNWTTFHDTFMCTVDGNVELSNVEKMSYLLNLIEGDAEQALKGFSLTNDNYKLALEALEERFGDKQMIVTSHMNKLLELPAVDNVEDTKGLRNLYDIVETQIRSLTAFDLEIENYGSFLVPVIMSKIPSEIKLILTRQLGKNTWDAKVILQSLQKEIEAREKLNITKNDEKFNERDDFTTGFSLLSGVKRENYKKDKHIDKLGDKRFCVFCSEKHKPQFCKNVVEIEARKEKLRRKGMCYLCLRKGHTVRNCQETFKCFKCKGKHHVAVCDRVEDQKGSQGLSNDNDNGSVNFSSNGKNVLLQTARAKISSTDERKCGNFRILFDLGSQHSYISHEARNLLGLETLNKQSLNVKVFGGSEKSQELDEVKFAVKNASGSQNIYVNAFVSTICKPLSGQTIDLATRNCEHLKGLQLADANPSDSDLKIDVLIGSDFYWDFMSNDYVRGKENGLPVAVKSILGYVLSGPIPQMSNFCGVVSTHTLKIAAEQISPELDLNSKVEKFWDLETVGVKTNEKDFVDEFKEKVKFNGERYEVELPFKDNVASLTNNYDVCKSRLKSLWRKMGTNSKLFNDYKQIIYEQKNLEVIEEVATGEPGDGMHYLPHRAVVRPDKATTKTRMVFDASSKKENEFSLNECLMTGPSLTPSLFGVLARFRTYNYVIVGDIEKAFLQISIKPEERDYVRFLWFKDPENVDFENFENNELTEYIICRVLFGATSSPFILNCVLIEHIENNSEENPEFALKLLESLHVDDLNSGAKTKKEAIEFYLKAKSCLEKGSFNLRKFQSNCKELENQINDFEFEPSQKILGVGWDKERDEIYFDLKHLIEANCFPTKRNIMKFIASIYDPLGLINPIVVKLKILFQDLCIAKIEWDNEIEGEFLERWNVILIDFENAERISFPRLYSTLSDDVKNIQLHVFCDASKRAYGCCAYLRYFYNSGEIKTSLIAAKSRISPIKETTMPRLELLSALLGARLTETLLKELRNAIDIDENFLWTDSSIAYSWIENTHKQYHQFVQNRVREIREKSDLCSWKLVNSENNPADIISRGVDINSLAKSHFWRHGPDFLSLPGAGWPSLEVSNVFSDDAIKEEKISSNSCLIIPSMITSGNCLNIKSVIDINNYSSLSKILRVTAFVMRFIRKLKNKLQKKEEEDTIDNKLQKKEEEDTIDNKLQKKEEEDTIDNKLQKKEEEDTIDKMWLGAEEIVNAMECWIINEQEDANVGKDMDIFIDSRGMIRCKGRVRHMNSTFDAKFPILLETKSKLTELLVLDAHEKVKHNGVKDTLTFLQEKFWIRKGRSFVRKLLHRCVVCRKFEGKTLKYPSPPDLPHERMDDLKPFNSIGIDYAGPLYVKEVFNRDLPTNKCWIALITCASTRAVCLDVAKDISADTCIEVLRRFTCRRGTPRRVVSDNGSNFTATEVQSFAAGRGMRWRFNMEAAPWQGGFFERLVKSVKRCLRKTVLKAKLSYDELYTVLLEIEITINNRPLTYLYNEPGSEPLTPNHLLFGRRINIYSVEEYPFNEIDSPTSTNCKYKTRNIRNVLANFWNMWKREYVMDLRDFHIRTSKKQSGESVKPGDVVVIHDDNEKRNQWKLGRVENIVQSSDGKTRGCRLLISHDSKNVCINRPINKLTKLEIQDE